LVKLLFLFGAISSCPLYLFISLKKEIKRMPFPSGLGDCI
jgi:hypothetical protein